MIRRVAPLALLFVALALVAAPARAQTLAGTWTLTSEGRGGQMTRTLVLTQSGSTLSGTISFAFGGRRGGGGGGEPQTFQISDGRVEGNTFSFSMTIEVQGNSITQRYAGTFDGDAMQGQIEGGPGGGRGGGRGGPQAFTGRRGG